MKRTPLNPKRLTPRRKGEPAPRIKAGNFRSDTLRSLARFCPVCTCCGTPNPDPEQSILCGAHWRELGNGAGTGLKPNDLLAYVCKNCHDLIDQRFGDLSSTDRFVLWARAHMKSTLWLIRSGHLEVAA